MTYSQDWQTIDTAPTDPMVEVILWGFDADEPDKLYQRGGMTKNPYNDGWSNGDTWDTNIGAGFIALMWHPYPEDPNYIVLAPSKTEVGLHSPRPSVPPIVITQEMAKAGARTLMLDGALVSPNMDMDRGCELAIEVFQAMMNHSPCRAEDPK